MNKELNNTIINDDILKISNAFKTNDNNFEIYLVGGCVRDYVLGNKPHDFDMTTNATPSEIKEILRINNIDFHNLGEKFGTIVARLNGEEYEITTYRTEQSYSDGRHPDEVQFSKSLEEDLSRRDFTINAMAMDPFTGEIIDPFSGLDDIENRTIRAVGDPGDRFKEDGLRILRALRFAIRYEFAVDRDTKIAMLSHKNMLNNVSRERCTDELRKIFEYNKPIKDLFNEFKEIIFKILPDLKPLDGCEQNNKYHHESVWLHTLSVVDNIHEPNFILKLAGLLHDIGKPATKTTDENGQNHFIGHPVFSEKIVEKMLSTSLPMEDKKLILSKKEYEHLSKLVSIHDNNLSISKKHLRKALVKYGPDFIKDWRILSNADFSAHVVPKDITEEKMAEWHTDNDTFNQMLNEILEEEQAFSLKDLKINGNDLRELGIAPGPTIGFILKNLFDDVINERILNDKEILLSKSQEMINSYNNIDEDIQKSEDKIKEQINL